MTDLTQGHPDAPRSFPVGQHPSLPPPPGTTGVIGWMRKNLFSSIPSAILTLAAVYAIYLLLSWAINWIVLDSVISGTDQTLCRLSGSLNEFESNAQATNWDQLQPPPASLQGDELARYMTEQESAQKYVGRAASSFNTFNVRLIETAKLPPEALDPIAGQLKELGGIAQQVDSPGLSAALDKAVADKDWAAARGLIDEAGPLTAWGDSYGGACWTVVKVRINQLLFYRYPPAEQWRPILTGVLLLLALAPLLFKVPGRRELRVFTYLFPIVAFFLLTGFSVSTASIAFAIYFIVSGAVLLSLIAGPPPQALAGPGRSLRVSFAACYAVISGLLGLIFLSDLLGLGLFQWFQPGGDGITTYLLMALVAIFSGLNLLLGYGTWTDTSWARALGLGVTVANILIAAAASWMLVPGASTEVLPVVPTGAWGGLMVTIITGAVGIAASLPIGIVLALGRRSRMPIVRFLCIAFIEAVRGVPMITLLFMASNMLQLWLPPNVSFDGFLRALIVVVLFASAYMAEVIRGGLQAIPKGQYEAADALGLSYWKKMRLIVLPQALRITLPGIVNTFIGLFKDTTLLLTIGIFDFLGAAQAVVTDAKWKGLAHELYVFLAIVYFLFCFSMSRYSLYLERKLHTGHKRR